MFEQELKKFFDEISRFFQPTHVISHDAAAAAKHCMESLTFYYNYNICDKGKQNGGNWSGY